MPSRMRNCYRPHVYPDIYNYFVLAINYATQEDMRMFKSLEAHNFFTRGFGKCFAAMQLPSKRVIVLSEMNHSQRLRDTALKACILAIADGTVITAHCTCMAGQGEACSHVGAMLFAVETAVRIRDARTSTERSNIWLSAFTLVPNSSASEKSTFLNRWTKSSMRSMAKIGVKACHKPYCLSSCSHRRGNKPFSLEGCCLHGVKPAILMVHPQYSAVSGSTKQGTAAASQLVMPRSVF
ncbi:hypothetical protein HPB48_005133 [Haemaphysalis longicornis]|uniref:SWIM-type domain-containing protein n=1 Tax=Haemaphysalis longicornis TaxID=44386 RepID=A0A9J6FF75_HAELO|nr:hypothetical protein HPB48_005133 [Haemaphysalis longicornis]